MSEVFTDYVRALDPAGEPPDAESFERVWAALGRVLVSELKKRGLWASPPSYLGIHGYRAWRETPAGEPVTEAPDGEPTGGAPAPGEALEELLAACYSHIFIRRLGGLKAQLKVKPNIEGLVFLNVRNFLHDAQKKSDPFGFRIYDVLRRALGAALDAGELARLAGDRRIRNDTVLAFDPAAGAEAAAGQRLDDAVRPWNDLLLPDLVTARGKALERVVGLLVSLVSRLPAAGVEAFTFQQLIDPLKDDARARWSALLAAEEGPTAIENDGGLPSLVRQIQPDTGVEDRDRFDKLSACLAESLERIEEPARTRAYLSALWQYLRAFALGAAGGDGRRGAAGGGLPSGRKLARHLGIPRDRLPGLFETLGHAVESCRTAISEGPTISGKAPVNSLVEDRDQDMPNRRQSKTPRRAP